MDLKDAYFHIQIAPHHRRFLRFAFEGVAYQFKVLLFGLALAPHVFTMCMNTALAPLKLSGMCILNYLDDWLVIARLRSALEEHKHRLLAHLTGLGLSVNIQKSTLQQRQYPHVGVESGNGTPYNVFMSRDSCLGLARPYSSRVLLWAEWSDV